MPLIARPPEKDVMALTGRLDDAVRGLLGQDAVVAVVAASKNGEWSYLVVIWIGKTPYEKAWAPKGTRSWLLDVKIARAFEEWPREAGDDPGDVLSIVLDRVEDDGLRAGDTDRPMLLNPNALHVSEPND